MAEYIIVILAAFGASMLTFFSGFGLGTLLTPVFMLFFPIEVAIAMTGFVHLVNNIFKFGLIGGHVDWKILLKFGVPAILGALGGAWLLLRLSGLNEPIASFNFFDRQFEIVPVKLVIAVLMILFGLVELIPALKKLNFSKKYLVVGGVLSGFFGGLSGHQGALRTAFLVKLGLTKETFIATGIAIALLIDLTRLPMYSTKLFSASFFTDHPIIIAATVSAFGGALLGRYMLRKITFDVIHTIVGIAIIILAIGLGLGII